ncbi:hypothetical protein FA95DRAFT_1606705 [Auriscalpium vulgare]|uniref:Uncharacterized protein n=1 Tax=Auriscalpium vulgare TaxID=40419 RepID=A0ACB8RRI9_9AGAM|nr:hypothetical protein FA95DRAFT_1606705 [Auriscalpium vulgare]
MSTFAAWAASVLSESLDNIAALPPAFPHISSTPCTSTNVRAETQDSLINAPWSPIWNPWTDTQSVNAMSNADAQPSAVNVTIDVDTAAVWSNTFSMLDGIVAVNPADLSLAPASEPFAHTSRDAQPPSATAHDFHFLTTTTTLLQQQRTYGDTHTIIADSSPPSLALNALPLPPSPSLGSSTSPARRKHRPPPLRCTHCPFVQENGRAWDLKRHVKTHDGVRKKFVCGRRGCKEEFSRMDGVRRHQKSRTARCAMAQGGDV